MRTLEKFLLKLYTKSRIVFSRNHSKFVLPNSCFFSKENIDCCRKSNQTFLNVLNKLAPLKKKRLRANHVSYVSTSMRKALFRRSYLENFNFKKRTNKSLKAYKNRKIIAAGFTKRNVKNALTN